jgi:hypothetical protein
LSRCMLVLSFACLAGLGTAQEKNQRKKTNPGPQRDVQKDPQTAGKKVPLGGRPLVDTAAFLREFDRDKDGFLSKDEVPDWLNYQRVPDRSP